jgi:predicted transcriptional regulator
MPVSSTIATGTDDERGAERVRDQQAVFDALDEPVCREILNAVQREARTAQELATECERSLSTIYRKISLLSDAGLIEEHTRIQTRGKHASQYTCAFENVCIHMGADGLVVTVD